MQAEFTPCAERLATKLDDTGRLEKNYSLLRFPLLARIFFPVFLWLAAGAALGQDAGSSRAPSVCASCIHDNLTYLAGPELHGRGSGTHDEYNAALYIAKRLRAYGLAPAAGNAYVQVANLKSANGNISRTWNVLAKIEGTTQAEQIILLSAHMDHLGIRQGKVYPGADDDASGTVAVMELARALAAGPQPQRTVIVALWGSEETGLVGAQYFLKHPTFDVHRIVANLEFEMIGRPDPKVKPEQLWLTGWERTDLGPELASRGAHLVADPHPEQNFFTRSDNYALAHDGIVAQTVSSYGLHKDYHQPTDTLDKIDWHHLNSAIGSMIAPISWLANSDYRPEWKKGKRP